MRRIPSGQSKSTPNTNEEPDLYVIAEQYPLEKSADVARKAAAAPDMESLSNHQWDPYQHYSTLPPQQLDAPYAAAAVNWYEGNNIVNQPTTSVGQYHHSFASAGVGTGVAKKEGDDQTIKSSAQDVMNYDPFPVSNHHFDAPYAAAAVNWCEGNTVNQLTTSVGQYHHSFASAAAGTGAAKKEGDDHQTTKPSGQDMMKNYDPFPMSNHHLDSHRGHSSMHPAHQGADTNQYSDGSNINQYAAGSSHQDVAAARYYYSQPQYSQQHEAHNGNNMLNHNYGSNHQWNPYQYHHYSTLPPQPQLDAPYVAADAAAVNWYEGNGNTANQPTTSVGQYHSFASAGVGTGAAKKGGDDQTKLSAHDRMNYGHYFHESGSIHQRDQEYLAEVLMTYWV